MKREVEGGSWIFEEQGLSISVLDLVARSEMNQQIFSIFPPYPPSFNFDDSLKSRFIDQFSPKTSSVPEYNLWRSEEYFWDPQLCVSLWDNVFVSKIGLEMLFAPSLQSGQTFFREKKISQTLLNLANWSVWDEVL